MNLLKAAALLLVLSSLVLAGCNQPGDDDEGDFETTPISVNVQYDGVAIAAFGTNFYRFTTAGAGPHEIALTNLTSDMSWIFFENNDVENPGTYYQCDDWDGSNDDEIAMTPALVSGRIYYIAVDEWDNVQAAFSLLISYP